MGKKLGHLSAWIHVGNLLGIGMGGALAALVGYHGSFLILVGVAVICVVLGLFLPHVERKPSGRTVWQITAGIVRFVRYPQVWIGIFASFTAALPSTLTQSLFPVYLSQLNYGEQWIGLTVSGRALGTIVIVLILGPLITAPRLMGFFALGMAGMGAFVAGSGLMQELYFIAPCIVAVGAAGGVLDLWYQVQATGIERGKGSIHGHGHHLAGMASIPNNNPLAAWMACGYKGLPIYLRGYRSFLFAGGCGKPTFALEGPAQGRSETGSRMNMCSG